MNNSQDRFSMMGEIISHSKHQLSFAERCGLRAAFQGLRSELEARWISKYESIDHYFGEKLQQAGHWLDNSLGFGDPAAEPAECRSRAYAALEIAEGIMKEKFPDEWSEGRKIQLD